MVCVILVSHARSLAISVTSSVEKNLTPFSEGFPRGFSKRDAMRIGMLCRWHPSTQFKERDDEIQDLKRRMERLEQLLDKPLAANTK